MKFEIGEVVTSQYHGITGTVVAHLPSFLEEEGIMVEYRTHMLGRDSEYVTLTRSFMARDFSKS